MRGETSLVNKAEAKVRQRKNTQDHHPSSHVTWQKMFLKKSVKFHKSNWQVPQETLVLLVPIPKENEKKVYQRKKKNEPKMSHSKQDWEKNKIASLIEFQLWDPRNEEKNKKKQDSSCLKKPTKATRMVYWRLFCILSSQPSLWFSLTHTNAPGFQTSRGEVAPQVGSVQVCIKDAKQLQVIKRPL